MTSYDGQTITYDNSGNPTSYLNGMSFSWNNGRQLSNISFSDNTYASYKYNQDGLRTHKETSEYSVDYTWDDNQLVREQVTDKAINKTYDVWYLYDESGKAIGFQYYYKYYAGSSTESLGRATIYYEKDLQGNVIGLVSIDGQEFATYRYDAWGNVTASSCTQSGNLACQLNNITYRGYYRDRETGFYYLQSRYYDPQTGRFINADDIDALGMETSSIFRDNLYVYCNSNPVKNVDENGKFSVQIYIAATVIAAIMGAVGTIISNYLDGKRGTKLLHGVLGASFGNAVNVALLMLLIKKGTKGMIIAALAAGIVQAICDYIESVVLKKKTSLKGMTYNFILNTGSNLAGNYIGAKMVYINKGWFQPKKLRTFFRGSYGKRIIRQTGIGSLVSTVISTVKNKLGKIL